MKNKIFLLYLLLSAVFAYDSITGLPLASRSEGIAENGMAATSHPLATQTAIQVLKDGGNAIDAAVAVAFALAVVNPSAGNLGGGGFMLIHLAETNETLTIDYRERAPIKSFEKMFLNDSGKVIKKVVAKVKEKKNHWCDV